MANIEEIQTKEIFLDASKYSNSEEEEDAFFDLFMKAQRAWAKLGFDLIFSEDCSCWARKVIEKDGTGAKFLLVGKNAGNGYVFKIPKRRR